MTVLHDYFSFDVDGMFMREELKGTHEEHTEIQRQLNKRLKNKGYMSKEDISTFYHSPPPLH